MRLCFCSRCRGSVAVLHGRPWKSSCPAALLKNHCQPCAHTSPSLPNPPPLRQLCTEGYYDGTIFHRIIKDFMVQGEGGRALQIEIDPLGVVRR